MFGAKKRLFRNDVAKVIVRLAMPSDIEGETQRIYLLLRQTIDQYYSQNMLPLQTGMLITYNFLLKIFKDSEWDFYAHKLHVYLEERSPGIEKIIAGSKSPGSEELPDDDIPQTIVDMFGIELFEGDYGAKLREMILNKLFARNDYDKIKYIYFAASHNHNLADERQRFEAGNKEKISREYVEELTKNRSKFKWRSGKYYAREFATILKIPEIFAGIPGDPKEERTVEVPPRSKIYAMKNFQKNMKNQVVEILYEKDIEKNRAILTNFQR